MNSITTLTTFLTLMVAISVAVERIVEIIKGIAPPLSKPWSGRWEFFRFAILHILAAVAGASIACAAHDQISTALPMFSFANHVQAGYVVIGLMASGGSAMWNHALDIVQAMKIKRVSANPPIGQ